MLRTLTCVLLSAALLTSGAASALIPEETAPAPAVPEQRPAAALGSATARTAWLEGLVHGQLDAFEIPGAAIAIVDTQGPALVRGFGYANVAERLPVDPNRSRFRIASVTKTFTWAAVMRLVLDGTLDLDADIRDYTSVNVPVVNGRAVTLADLMTHSAGFEERAIGAYRRPGDGPQSPDKWLAAERPDVVYKPGHVPAYSNYGTALAGQIAADASGQSWSAMIESWFLSPLAMNQTSTAQPLPGALAGAFAPGHGPPPTFEPRAFGILHEAAAGAMSATASDMARWVEVHLRAGRVGNAQLLPEELVAAMARPLRAFLPQQHPFLHGFYRMDRAGEVIYGHHGDLEDSHSVFALLPERGLGVFAVYNGSGGPAANMLLDAIVDRLQGRTLPPAIEPPADFAGRADRYTGEYASSRRNFSTLEKAALLGGALTVSASAEGYLVTQGPTGPARHWVETAPDRFRARDGHAEIRFEETDAGNLRLWSGSWPGSVHERLGIWAAPSTHMTLLTVTTTVFVLAMFGYGRAGLTSSRPRMVFGDERRLPTGPITLAWLASVLGLALLLGLALTLGDSQAFNFEVPAFVAAQLWAAAAFAVLTLLLCSVTLRVHSSKQGSLGQRLRLTTVCLAAVAQTASFHFWNLMPWGLP